MTDSVFDPASHIDRLDRKIVVGLERLSGAFRYLFWQQNLAHGLSPIQIQLLMFVSCHEDAYCKISYLATEFNLTKPTISDSVKTLEKKNLIEKVSTPEDSRSYTIRPTPNGRRLSDQLSSFANTILQSVNELSTSDQRQFWNSLVTIISSLQKKDIISLQRMCFSCSNYRKDDRGHFCTLLNQPLSSYELRIDCEEHQAMT